MAAAPWFTASWIYTPQSGGIHYVRANGPSVQDALSQVTQGSPDFAWNQLTLMNIEEFPQYSTMIPYDTRNGSRIRTTTFKFLAVYAILQAAKNYHRPGQKKQYVRVTVDDRTVGYLWVEQMAPDALRVKRIREVELVNLSKPADLQTTQDYIKYIEGNQHIVSVGVKPSQVIPDAIDYQVAVDGLNPVTVLVWLNR